MFIKLTEKFWLDPVTGANIIDEPKRELTGGGVQRECLEVTGTSGRTVYLLDEKRAALLRWLAENAEDVEPVKDAAKERSPYLKGLPGNPVLLNAVEETVSGISIGDMVEITNTQTPLFGMKGKVVEYAYRVENKSGHHSLFLRDELTVTEPAAPLTVTLTAAQESALKWLDGHIRTWHDSIPANDGRRLVGYLHDETVHELAETALQAIASILPVKVA